MKLALCMTTTLGLLLFAMTAGGTAVPSLLGLSPVVATPPDTDGDGDPDVTDPDDDNDGVLDINDNNSLDPFQCEDVDSDACDDCSVGVDGFGPLPDNTPNNDGFDFDGDGLCAFGDSDDDDDGWPDFLDNCVHAANVSQLDTDADGYGDACDCEPNNSNIPTVDADGDGFGAECDCDDTDGTVFPGSGCNTVAVDEKPWSTIKTLYR